MYVSYERGYLITKADSCPLDWKKIQHGTYHVYYDSKNNAYSDSMIGTKAIVVTIIGLCIDTEDSVLDIREICKRMIAELNKSELDFHRYFGRLNGRFIVLFSLDNETKVITDFTGMKTCFYDTVEGNCSSHYELLSTVSKRKCNYIDIWEDYISLPTRPWTLPGD